MSPSPQALLILPQVARLTGVSEFEADYAASSNRIEPACRVGIVRLFDRDAIARIVLALKRAGAIKNDGGPTPN